MPSEKKSIEYLAGYAEGYRVAMNKIGRTCKGCKWEDMQKIGCSQCARRHADQYEPMEEDKEENR